MGKAQGKFRRGAVIHVPVLLQEVVRFLDPKAGKVIIDATAGAGGHTEEFLRRGAQVLAIDRDPEAIKYLKKSYGSQVINHKLVLAQGNFANIGEIAQKKGFSRVDGILFDLGISSDQLADAKRGFAFAKVGPLDMRMDPNLEVTAYDLVNNFDERRLYEIFSTYGQEKFSRAIARAICRARQIAPINSTQRLANIIREVYGKKNIRTKLDCATKSFLALRIVVNSELINLENALPQTIEILKKGGRLAIVSFHSLEDGLVKRFFKQEKQLLVLTKKPVTPGASEILKNPRSRSAKLRVAEKI
ncbi:16S rRNA (cytosine(1402)-N(4))-methyltransferase [Candidatus Curtissbacteria bacterium RIFCSPHIGHO2_12_FULL_41_17]|uniref:Ribosomal RNA small subunit methyltransferase H n=2 Tax=Candidatus Curtissiibacteriota TaxID=1752717 RepID=A0A1F5HKD5_9BACT|nr:MAG: 16S rRNA (cytosine(1402)-N(4))-methyltransferase [Candidatus Curtissbacteria bacterium RIFCSPHIGHO2_01_FULL_40_12]OGE04563.1 MAG: 16S rRNA (cytosine(1402)-N(4))-methyltransferase [Candidatus Curtissbacteria bacterium RIFCSPHIGHO2_12_FULL_41_17]